MATIHKFMFDTSFDEEPRTKPRVEEVAPAEPEDVEQAPVYSAEDVEAARQRGLETGREEGNRAALDGIEAKLAATLDRIFAELPNLFAAHEESVSHAHADAIAIAGAVAAKLFPALNEKHGLGEVTAMVEQALTKLTDEPRVAIRVAADLVEPLRARVAEMSRSRGVRAEIDIQGDENILLGDCRLIWSDGSSERDTVRLLAEIEEIVARHVGPFVSHAEPPPSDPEAAASPENGAETEPVPQTEPDAAPSGEELS